MNLTENPNPADRTQAAGLSRPALWHFPNTCAVADTGSRDIRVLVQDLRSRARLRARHTTPGWIRGQTPLTWPAEAVPGTGTCCSVHAWKRKRGFEPENQDPASPSQFLFFLLGSAQRGTPRLSPHPGQARILSPHSRGSLKSLALVLCPKP